MRKFYEGILNHRKIVIAIFSVLFVFSLLCAQLVSVNHDITDYLPKHTKSTVSVEIMEQEFDGGIPNARVMIKGITVPEALEYKKALKNVKGVTELTWLDDAADITIPLSALDADTVETYYKDNTAFPLLKIYGRLSAMKMR